LEFIVYWELLQKKFIEIGGSNVLFIVMHNNYIDISYRCLFLTHSDRVSVL